MAACLRNIYMGDPFTLADAVLPELPRQLQDEVVVRELVLSNTRCVIYSPIANFSASLLLYMHGGGFVVGCSEDTDYIARRLCHSNQLNVVSVNYRLAPESKFPNALDDCEAVLRAILAEQAALKLKVQSIFLGGDSAGGNLAMALYQRVCNQLAVDGLVLLAPWLDMELEKYDSYNRLAPEGIVFDAAFMGYARGAYVGYEQWSNPLVSPLHFPVEKLPPTIALIGTQDPLLDQVIALKRKGESSGCGQLEVQVFAEMPHCFYSFPGVFTEEEDGFSRIRSFFKKNDKH